MPYSSAAAEILSAYRDMLYFIKNAKPRKYSAGLALLIEIINVEDNFINNIKI